MRQTWEDYNRSAERGPGSLAVRIIVGMAGAFLLIGVIGYAFGWLGEAGHVAQAELGPQALLDKYNWLKEAHAQLDKKRADMAVYETRNKSLDDAYKGQPRSAWSREDREQWATWQSELAGIKASYNDLAARYNAKMAEVQWRFTNVGTLPQGATEPLPREYAPYEEK